MSTYIFKTTINIEIKCANFFLCRELYSSDLNLYTFTFLSLNIMQAAIFISLFAFRVYLH